MCTRYSAHHFLFFAIFVVEINKGTKYGFENRGNCTKEQFENALDMMENRLGHDRLNVFHSHFSKIQYTDKGEKKHLTFEDTLYGPDFEPLCVSGVVSQGMIPKVENALKACESGVRSVVIKHSERLLECGSGTKITL